MAPFLPRGFGRLLPFGGRSSSARMQRIFRGEAALSRRRHPLLWSLAGLLLILAVWPSPGRPDREATLVSPTYSQPACFELVGDTGRLIAWARWQGNLSFDKVRNVSFEDGTPEWIVGRVRHWIVDAYTWQPTDDQVLQWAEELGSTQWLPRASQLTDHESIAIWLRRIARGCGPDERAGVAGRV